MSFPRRKIRNRKEAKKPENAKFDLTLASNRGKCGLIRRLYPNEEKQVKNLPEKQYTFFKEYFLENHGRLRTQIGGFGKNRAGSEQKRDDLGDWGVASALPQRNGFRFR
jgi:hypothetical protein